MSIRRVSKKNNTINICFIEIDAGIVVGIVAGTAVGIVIAIVLNAVLEMAVVVVVFWI